MTLARIAARNLLRNRRRTLLSLAGITIGVVAMVGFRGLIIGQREMMLGNLVQGVAGAVQIHKKGYVANVQALPLSLAMADSEDLRRRIRAVEGVVEVAPRITFGAMLSLPEGTAGTGGSTPDLAGKTGFFVVTAIDPVLERKVTPRRFDWMAEGRVFDSSSERAVVLNEDLARSLGLDPTASPSRDELQWPGLVAADKDGAPNGEAVVLTGVFNQGAPGDKKNGIVALAVAQRLLRMEGQVTEYAVAVRSLDEAHAVRDRLRQALGPDYEVHAWDELLPFINDMIGIQDLVLGLVGLVVLVTVLLVIANAMLMNVLERVREIGTMLAVGTRRRQVSQMFLQEGAILGAVGGLVGALLGYALVVFLNQRGIPFNTPGTNFTNLLRPFVPLAYLAQAVLTATLGAALAAVWPAWRASKLQPVDALRAL
jgi:putative ABC transport system permease protein